jgi:hypothetical protein
MHTRTHRENLTLRFDWWPKRFPSKGGSAIIMNKSKNVLWKWFQASFIGWMRLWSSYVFKWGRLQTSKGLAME